MTSIGCLGGSGFGILNKGLALNGFPGGGVGTWCGIEFSSCCEGGGGRKSCPATEGGGGGGGEGKKSGSPHSTGGGGGGGGRSLSCLIIRGRDVGNIGLRLDRDIGQPATGEGGGGRDISDSEGGGEDVGGGGK